MKGMPLPFEFEKGVVLGLEGVLVSSCSSDKYRSTKKSASVVSSEPASVLDTRRSPSPPTSTSTLSSSLGGGGGGGGSGGGVCSSETVGVAAVSGNPSTKWPPSSSTSQQENISSNAAVVESSQGGGGMKKDDWGLELQPIPSSLDIIGGGGGGGGGGCGGDVAVAGIGKCGMGMEDWECVLSEPAAASSPGQEPSILRLIMGDVEDPSMGLSKLLQSGGVGMDFDFNGGFVDPQSGFGFEGGNLMGNLNTSSSSSVSVPCSGFPTCSNSNNNSTTININSGRFGSLSIPTSIPNFKATANSATPIFGSPPTTNNVLPISLSPGMFHQQQQRHAQFLPQPHQFESPEEKPQIVNPQTQMLLNQHQAHHLQNPSFMLPLSFTQQEHQQLLPPHPKRHNPGIVDSPSQILKTPFLDSGQEAYLRRPPQPGISHQLQWLPHYGQQRPTMAMKPKMGSEEMAHQQQQNQAIYDQLYKAAELVETGNSVLAQSILARLNHQLSQIGKPFHRAAYFFKEALQLLLDTNGSNITPSTTGSYPINLIFKIGAYKSFSEISPILQFANFTCNQALLEALDGFDRIHIIDFDIGFGGQWASLMQELSMRSGGAPSLKITAFASPSTHDQIELCLTRENLNYFASEINIPFELEIVSIDSLNSASMSFPLHVLDSEAIAVNLPVGASCNYLIPLPMVLRFVKQLSPKIVVSVDRGCDRTDLPFAQHFVNALQSNSYLLESLDAVNVNLDALQKIEKYLLQPSIQKLVLGRYNSPEKTPPWRTLFLSTGLSPLTFSNFTESQAECVVKKTPVRGFHVEKKQTSLVLCWQRKELISASAWRC